jgi:hypothetical protein
MQLVQLEAFKKEIVEFPIESREDIVSLVSRFLKGEQLNRNDFKTFKIDKNTRIQEFRVKDHRGNWRAISTIVQGTVFSVCLRLPQEVTGAFRKG